MQGRPHGNGTYVALNGDRYEGGFRNGVVTGPGTIFEVNGNIRFVKDSETITFRNSGNKYVKLINDIVDFLGMRNFVDNIIRFLIK